MSLRVRSLVFVLGLLDSLYLLVVELAFDKLLGDFSFRLMLHFINFLEQTHDLLEEIL